MCDNLAAFEQSVEQLEEEKKYVKAFKYCQAQIIGLYQRAADPASILPCVASAVHRANKNSMELLQAGKPRSALSLLTLAEQLIVYFRRREPTFFMSKDMDVFMNLTYTSMSCVFKCHGNPTAALQCLNKVVEGSPQPNEENGFCIMHINKSTLLSQLGRHKAAVEEATKAKEIMIISIDRAEKLSDGSLTHELQEKRSLLGLAYHGLGAEYERMRNTKCALGCYEQACDCVKNCRDVGGELKFQFFSAQHRILQKLFPRKAPTSAKPVSRTRNSENPSRCIYTYHRVMLVEPPRSRSLDTTRKAPPSTKLRLKDKFTRLDSIRHSHRRQQTATTNLTQSLEHSTNKEAAKTLSVEKIETFRETVARKTYKTSSDDDPADLDAVKLLSREDPQREAQKEEKKEEHKAEEKEEHILKNKQEDRVENKVEDKKEDKSEDKEEKKMEEKRKEKQEDKEESKEAAKALEEEKNKIWRARIKQRLERVRKEKQIHETSDESENDSITEGSSKLDHIEVPSTVKRNSRSSVGSTGKTAAASPMPKTDALDEFPGNQPASPANHTN